MDQAQQRDQLARERAAHEHTQLCAAIELAMFREAEAYVAHNPENSNLPVDIRIRWTKANVEMLAAVTAELLVMMDHVDETTTI